MSDRAAAFLAEWIRDNLVDCSADDGAAAEDALMKDAHSLGIGLGEFAEEVGNVRAYLSQRMIEKLNTDVRAMSESGTSDA